MRKLTEHNPIVIFLFYLAVLLPVLFTVDPALSLISALGAFLCLALVSERGENRKVVRFLLLPVLGAVLNPLYNHSGATPLFFINENPVTLESVLYGFCSGLMILSCLVWFRSFSVIFTSDRLLYLFGSFSPKISLILSMTLRYIPLYRKQVRKTRDAQTVLGQYGDNDLLSRLRGGLRVFSVMVTWALENGVTTADSMTARGYGVGRRSFFAIFSWRRDDTVLCLLVLIPAAAVLLGLGIGTLGTEWFPEISGPGLSGIPFYAVYGILCMIPAVLQAGEERRWKKLQSEI